MTASLTTTQTGLQAEMRKLASGFTPVGKLAFVYFDNRRIWTFRVEEQDWNESSSTLSVKWPAALIPHLAGLATGKLEIHKGPEPAGTYIAEGPLSFGDSKEKMLLVDPTTGQDQVVNKWGRIAKSFETMDPELMSAVLGSAKRLITLLSDAMGLEPFITGGTLLGLVRDGKLIDTDDDADLAYISKYENPSDVVLESYKVERLLSQQGLETVRHSSGHLQVMFNGTTYTDGFYVDIFTYFVTNEWFYGTFHAREKSEDVTVYPLKTITVGDLELPIPANTDQMLKAIYGPTWQVPDPAFTFVTPEAAGRRFYWWLNHFDMYREDWEDYHRGVISSGRKPIPSAMGEWLLDNLEAGSTVVELGCGLGADAQALAASGHTVLAGDYSRPAIKFDRTTAEAVRPNSVPDFRVINVNSIRDMATLVQQAAALAVQGSRVEIFARNLFDNIHYLGRDNTLFAISHLLERGGKAYLQMRNPKTDAITHNALEPVGERIFDPWEFEKRLHFYNLEVIEHNFIDDPAEAGQILSYIIGKTDKYDHDV